MVVLLSGDLMGMSRVEGSARQAGISFRFLPNVEAVAELCATQSVALVLVDLATPHLDVAELVRRLQSASAEQAPRIMAFGPHVHEAVLEAAAAAGCDQVLSRGAFMVQVDAILAQHAAANSPSG